MSWGPVDWIVVELPGSKFNGQIAPALLDLVERDLIRVLDLLVLKKDADGSLEAIGELRTYESLDSSGDPICRGRSRRSRRSSARPRRAHSASRTAARACGLIKYSSKVL